jgi:hypothetical protein
MCDNSNAPNVTMSLTSDEFNALTSAYSTSHAGETLGGNIDKSALLAICNSLSVESTVVYFRFCKEVTSGKTSVMFAGGNIGQPDGTNLYYRNSGSEEAFCPAYCND